MKRSLVEEIFRRILRESQEEREERGRKRMGQATGLAVYTKKTMKSVDIVLYSPQALLDMVAQSGRIKEKDPAFVNHIIRGVITAAKTAQPCNGAWAVSKAAVKNKGDGGLLYGLAFAGSNGPLTPDRWTVSSPAQTGWLGQNSRGGKTFDDVDNPKTADTSDDCKIHAKGRCGCTLHLDGAEEALNRTYEEEGWEENILYKLWDTHDTTMKKLGAEAPRAEAGLNLNSWPFFSKYYNPNF